MYILIHKMSHIRIEKRLLIVGKYFETKNFVTVKRQFGSTFNRESPCKKSIQNNIAKHRNLVTSLSRDK